MDMAMSSIRPTRVEVVTSVQRRRRWTPEQKLEIVKQTNEPGSSVSLVARQHGLTAAQLFQWRKAYLTFSSLLHKEMAASISIFFLFWESLRGRTQKYGDYTTLL